MTKAKLFTTGGSQAVRLPAELLFEVTKSISGGILKRGMWCFQSQLRHGTSISRPAAYAILKEEMPETSTRLSACQRS